MGIINLNLKCENTEVEYIKDDNIFNNNTSLNDEDDEESSRKNQKSQYTIMLISGCIVLIPTFGYGGYSIYNKFIDKTEAKPNLQYQDKSKSKDGKAIFKNKFNSNEVTKTVEDKDKKDGNVENEDDVKDKKDHISKVKDKKYNSFKLFTTSISKKQKSKIKIKKNNNSDLLNSHILDSFMQENENQEPIVFNPDSDEDNKSMVIAPNKKIDLSQSNIFNSFIQPDKNATTEKSEKKIDTSKLIKARSNMNQTNKQKKQLAINENEDIDLDDFEEEEVINIVKNNDDGKNILENFGLQPTLDENYAQDSNSNDSAKQKIKYKIDKIDKIDEIEQSDIFDSQLRLTKSNNKLEDLESSETEVIKDSNLLFDSCDKLPQNPSVVDDQSNNSSQIQENNDKSNLDVNNSMTDLGQSTIFETTKQNSGKKYKKGTPLQLNNLK